MLYCFVISKIVISVLIYRRWKRKKLVFEDGVSGGKMVLFRASAMQSLKSDTFLKKTLKLSNKDIIGSGGYGQPRLRERVRSDGDIKHRNIFGCSPTRKINGEEALDWPSRYKIALGTARGISYLHHDCIPHIIHRDIKSSNILLDQNMEARVSDFGLATLMEPDKTHVSTLVAGTFGYLAPEYFDTGRATAKGDVYSFGVVLLELLTGKKPTDEAFIEEGTKLVTWVKAVIQDKKEEYVIDSNLGCCPTDEINNAFSIALMCLEPEPSKRPTMVEVVKMLEEIKNNKVVKET
ncbi:Protein kinase superfamily protein [Prunus dulcis]|uniref:Protein kinase superfamily protein n=1 Tax=Prunus dulcis TaxID=3755 RepID=A0A4Y1RBL2_PRUDU|nr:Protein kinase superfamily protein [Prunus dulcis]